MELSQPFHMGVTLVESVMCWSGVHCPAHNNNIIPSITSNKQINKELMKRVFNVTIFTEEEWKLAIIVSVYYFQWSYFTAE